MSMKNKFPVIGFIGLIVGSLLIIYRIIFLFNTSETPGTITNIFDRYQIGEYRSVRKGGNNNCKLTISYITKEGLSKNFTTPYEIGGGYSDCSTYKIGDAVKVRYDKNGMFREDFYIGSLDLLSLFPIILAGCCVLYGIYILLKHKKYHR